MDHSAVEADCASSGCSANLAATALLLRLVPEDGNTFRDCGDAKCQRWCALFESGEDEVEQWVVRAELRGDVLLLRVVLLRDTTERLRAAALYSDVSPYAEEPQSAAAAIFSAVQLAPSASVNGQSVKDLKKRVDD